MSEDEYLVAVFVFGLMILAVLVIIAVICDALCSRKSNLPPLSFGDQKSQLADALSDVVDGVATLAKDRVKTRREAAQALVANNALEKAWNVALLLRPRVQERFTSLMETHQIATTNANREATALLDEWNGIARAHCQTYNSVKTAKLVLAESVVHIVTYFAWNGAFLVFNVLLHLIAFWWIFSDSRITRERRIYQAPVKAALFDICHRTDIILQCDVYDRLLQGVAADRYHEEVAVIQTPRYRSKFGDYPAQDKLDELKGRFVLESIFASIPRAAVRRE